MRSADDQLLETELMNSTPEHVYGWLKRRAEASDKEAYSGDQELEEALLTRESHLIDLGLARYGFSGAVVRKLFAGVHRDRGGTVRILDRSGHTMSSKTQVLRLAALSNCTLMKRRLSSNRMPQLLFSDSLNLEAMREFAETARSDEVWTLFKNPTIDGDILARLYAKDRPFDSLSEERWQELIFASIGSPRLRAGYWRAMDDSVSSAHWRVCREACTLATKVPTTKRWADILERLLSALLEGTPRELFQQLLSAKDRIVVIQRCQDSSSVEIDPASDFQSEHGYLDEFARMRLVLARLQLDSEIEALKNHEDVAMRCAFYQFGNPTPEQLREAHAKEPAFLLSYALSNDAVWRQRETREALSELCRAHKSNEGDVDYDLSFSKAYEEVQLKYPDWLKDESGQFKDSVSSAEAAVNDLKTLQASQADLINQIAMLRTHMTALLWIACILLALMLFRNW